MTREVKVNRVLTDLSYTGYTPELVRCEARLLIEELNKENENYKEVFAKLKKRINYMFQNEPINSAEYDYYIGKLNELLNEVE